MRKELMAVIIAIILQIFFDDGYAYDYDEKENEDICKTRECHQISTVFLEGMNKSIDPCVNFYDYVCGGWAAQHPIPKYAPGWSRFMMFQHSVNHRIKEVLETEPKPEDILPLRQAKKWYRSCMDNETREARGIKPIESILMQNGGWPMTLDPEEWNADDISWERLDGEYFRLTGLHTFFKIAFLPMTNEHAGLITIIPAEGPLGDKLPTTYRNYSGDDTLHYKTLIKGIARLFIDSHQANVPAERLQADVDDIVKFEEELQNLQAVDDVPAFTTVEEWPELYKANLSSCEKWQIDWKLILDRLFNFGNIERNESTQILASSVSYFTELTRLLNKTPTRILSNYIHWKFVSHALQYTNTKVQNLLLDLMKREYDIEKNPPQWLSCVQDMKMAHAIGFAFVDEYFDDETATEALELLKNIKNEMQEEIDSSNWSNEETKLLLKDKLKRMQTFIGYPEWYKNKSAVINYYKGLAIDYDYFDNALSFMRYKKKQEVLNSRVDEDSPLWRIEPTRVNAMYIPTKNAINVPAVDFQSPLFAPETPDYVNYAVTGMILAHEMSHAFDSRGILIGPDGDKSEIHEKMIEKYNTEAICFEKQFDEYFRNESSLNGAIDERYRKDRSTITMGENIADTMGLQSVFKAYKKMIRRKKPWGELKLPMFQDFSDDQLFFISFAGTWCEVGTEKFLKRRELSWDDHSPPHVRVLGALSNMQEFSQAFSCVPGTPMNTQRKCDIWKTQEFNANTVFLKYLQRRHRRFL